jgi:HlyD family secretion protein
MARTWRNWGRPQTCTPERILQPRTLNELVEIVRLARRSGRRVRVAGAGHSTGPLCTTNDFLVHLARDMIGRSAIRLLVVVVVLVLAVSVVVYQFWWAPRARQAEGDAAASPSPSTGDGAGDRRWSDRERVTALGRLAPRGEVISVGAPEGARLARILVTEGQRVRAGEPLVYLDAHAERLTDKQLILAKLTEAQTRLATETRHGQALIDEATARLRQVESFPSLEVQMQESRVRTLEAELAESERDLDRIRRLRAKDFVAEQDLDRQFLAVRRTQHDLAAARVLLDKLRQAVALDRSVAEAQLQTARATLAKAQSSIELDSLREALGQAEARLERSVIRAPVGGEILKIVSRPGETTGQRPILQMGDTSSMYAVAEVYETDVALVRPRQRARITSMALPRAVTGTVESVGTIVAKNAVVDVDPATAADRRVVEVKIALDESELVARFVSLQVEVSIDVRNP